MTDKIVAVLEDNPNGLRTAEIAQRLGVSKTWLGEYLVRLQWFGLVEMTAGGLVRLRRRREAPAGGPVTVRRLTPEEWARVRAGLPSDGIGPRWREVS